ncbi:hypothetical protein ACFWGY_26300, partial [Prauserella salsuginis]
MNARHDGVNINTADIGALLSGVGSRNRPNIAGQRANDGKTATRHDGMTATQPPSKSKFTVLLEQEDALAFDRLAYELRARTGRRVEKAEIIRVLIHLGLEHPPTD